MSGLVIFLFIVFPIAVVLGILLGKGINRAKYKYNSKSGSQAQPMTEYTNICPHCGHKTTAFYNLPTIWSCGECGCSFDRNRQITGATLAEYRIIEKWSGLDEFIEKILKVNSVVEKYHITLKNGSAFFYSEKNPLASGSMVTLENIFIANYPTEGISRVGELHLMYLCMERCRANNAETRNYWLMEHGFACE